jgi:hypothetical protein
MSSPPAAKPIVIAVVLLLARAAGAECPTTPDDPICRPWSAILLPTAYGTIYASRQAGTFYGGGVEAILLAWSDNSTASGPSQGRVRSDIGILTGGDTSQTIVMYRTGAQVAFERNASRSFGIPYFAADFGGLWSEATGRRWFVDAGVGLYVLHRRGLILDLEATGLLPFQDPGRLGGVTSRLALSFALW